MKPLKKLCFTVMLIAFIHNISPAQNVLQEGNNEESFNFLNPVKLPGDFTIPKGASVHYKISDINRSMYTVTINNTERSLFTEKPQIFNVLTNVDVSKLSSLATPAAAGAGLSHKKAFKKDKVSDELYIGSNEYYKKQFELALLVDDYITVNYQHLKNLNANYKMMLDILSDDCRKFSDLNALKVSAVSSTLTTDFGYTGPTDEVSIGSALKAYIDALFEDLSKQYDKIIKTQNELKILKTKYDQLIIKELTNKKTKSETSVLVKNEQAELATSDSIIMDAVEQAKTAHLAIESIFQTNFAASVKRTYDQINISNWTYVSPSYRANKDIMEISIAIQAKNQSVCSGNADPYNLTVHGKVTGFKVNFSTGLFLLAGKDLFDRSYKTEPITGDADNNIIIQNKSKKIIAPAIGALMHFYHYGGGNLNFGGSFGLSVNDDTNLNYHAGISTLCGNDNRLVFTIGATLSKVKQISSDFEVGGKIPKSITSVPTSDYYRGGFFFSFTYNLVNQ